MRTLERSRRAVAAAALAGCCLAARAAAADDSFALEKARVVGAGGVQEGVTLLIVGGRITALGSAVELPPGCRRIDASGMTIAPGFVDAFAELSPDPEQGTPLLARSEGEAQDYGRAAYAETAEASRRGLRPELRARALLGEPDRSALEKLRFAGFTAQLLAPVDGLLPGQACLIELSDEPARRAVVGEPGVLLLKFRSGGGGGGPRTPGQRRAPPPPGESGYPTTLMGGLAHLRQAFLDAQHLMRWRAAHAARPDVVGRPPDDECLETLAAALDRSLAVAFAVDRENDVRRALAFATEFGLKAWIVGGKEAWKCAAELAAADVPVIASLAFADEPTRRGAKKKEAKADQPKAAPDAPAVPPPGGPRDEPDETKPAPAGDSGVSAPERGQAEAAPEWEVEDPVLAEPEELFAERLADWRDEVRNVERLLAAGVTVALTQRGASNPGDFLADLRVAIEHGLAADAALAALTSTPARLLGGAGQLGTVQVGAPAHLVVGEGEWHAKERSIRHVFIGAAHFEAPPKPPPGEEARRGRRGGRGGGEEPDPAAPALDLSGAWKLEGSGGGGFAATLTLNQDGTALSGTLESEMGVAQVTSGSLDGERFELTVTAEFQGRKFEFRLEGTATKESLAGKFHTPFGEPTDFTARRPGLQDEYDHDEGCGCGAHPEDRR